MNRYALSCLIPSIFLVLLSTAGSTAATAQEQECQGKACVDFGGALDGENPVLPLEEATKTKVNKRRDKEKAEGHKHENRIHPQCMAELEKPPEERDEERIAKFCSKSPGHKKEVLKNRPIKTADGKQRGKSIKTRTTLTFEKPGQRYGHEKISKWNRVIVKPPVTGDMPARHYREQSNTKDRGRGKKFLAGPSAGTNDDRDCVDTFTREHKGGLGVPDGAANSCFNEDGSLKGTLTAVDSGGCVHDNGTFFDGAFPPEDEDGDGVVDENDCYDADGNLKNTLVELIDEDGPSPDNETVGDGVYDIDGDGLDGEDPPEQDGYAINNDNDCIDMVTGRHLRDGACFSGSGLRQTLSVAFYGCENGDGDFVEGDPYDGVADDCYNADGTPKAAMTPLADGCRHDESDTFFEGDPTDDLDDDCFDADNHLKTTLAELINEDDGLPVDDDDDGFVDEDGPDAPADFERDCHAKAMELADDPSFDTTGVYTGDGGCDLTRAIIVRANREAVEKSGKKAYKADDQGYFDDSVHDDAVEYGYEPRNLVIEEEFTVLCGAGQMLDEPTGQCIPDEQVEALADYRSVATGETSLTQYAMMGFTFAPPRVRWGLFYREELDLWFVTITLFEAKIGYDFALGVGFRLPMAVEVSNLPETSILAEQDLDLVSEVRPENFSVQQYEDFCADNGLGDSQYCERFAFPDALDPDDGDELAIRLTAFAGLKIVILSIPLINWGIDVDMDLSEMCSLYLAWNNAEDVAQEMVSSGVGFAEAVRNLGLNCGTYTTPYGNDDDGDPLQFPFIQNAPFVNQMIRADCAEAFVRGETIKLPDGKIFPLCTGLILGVHGASLGMGLGVDLEMNSNLVEANASVTGDSIFKNQTPGHVQELDFNAALYGGSEQVALETIRVDNYDDSDTEDHARLVLDDFTYCLNNFSIRLKGQAMFGGILTIFPDFPDFTIYRLTVPWANDTCFIPIGQHAGTKGVEVPVLVENYGVEVKVGTDPADPNRVDEKTLKYPPEKNQPGGDFLVSVKNIGSFSGDFDNFSYELSNQRDQTEPYTFVIDPDNDGDGLIDEDDFGPAGELRAVRDEDQDGMVDEDPPDNWQSVPSLIDFNIQALEEVPRHMRSEDAGIESLTLKITPFVHPSTSPGIYPFRVTADSREAKIFGLSPVDPSSNRRTGSADVAFIKVESFYDPRVAVQPDTPSAKPVVEVLYTIEGTNMGNGDDSMSVAVDFKDFNEAGCSLTDRGTLPGCPYRAEPTIIDAESWTTLAFLATQFGPLVPLGSETDTLAITVPGDWEGMGDTTYAYEVTVVSLEDDDPPTSNSMLVEHTVIATKESMTRYIRHEILDLIREIEAANDQGISTGGLLPIAMKPAQKKVDQALQRILAGNMSGASNALSSNIRILQAFVHALDGFNGGGDKIPAALDTDWHARAAAIIADLRVAAASEVGSAVP